MSAAGGSRQSLPLDDRSNALKIPIVILIIFSSVFAILRLSISWKNRKYFLLTDHFLWTGLLLAIVGAIFCYKMAEVGGGKHVWDPSMTPVHLENYLKYLWFGQLFNLYGMALIKLSICAYILMLDFSNVYRAIIWLSVIVHLAMNFVFPSVILLGECRPISKHWDGAGAQLDTCWSSQPRVISGYSGAATNICTDLVYAIAPLLYISRVQLSRRTLWGVRAVFLLGLMTTIISALKLYEMKSLWSSPDPTYTSVNLSIYAIAEVFVGAFTASLPPLRKTFEDLLRRILPGTILRSSRGTGNTYELKAPISEGSSRGSRPRRDRDSNSEHAILPEDQVVDDKGSDQAIVCTTDISMTVSRKSLSAQPVREWV